MNAAQPAMNSSASGAVRAVRPDLTGHTAVVTGAGRGIGLAITRALADCGARVIAGTHSRSDSLEDLAEQSSVEPVLVDLESPRGPRTLVESAGVDLDVLVNNLGRSTPRPHGIVAVTDHEWLESLQLNLLSAVRATRAAVPPMIARGHGAVVNVVSDNARLPDPGIVDYGAAKAALGNFTKACAKELAPHGISVNAINPGPVATSRWTEPELESLAARMPTGRVTTAEEVATIALFLAARLVPNLTGSTITVDGGYLPTV